ncbi:hypothetical protein COCNU_03G006090 [Cocos nucifera]|uniref:RIN4 pathogenic type III effector avirulence factor Avr cleavage site domain-containing protein n=1 Tax=Cocos nucifera TaxID=13894 RepID=A0A8K0I393_COCNU|nr:hypothetical protein COCNU_03G006090 [Cocos nucifera]
MPSALIRRLDTLFLVALSSDRFIFLFDSEENEKKLPRFLKGSMEDRKEQRKGRMSVPSFGDWDQNNGLPDYSLDFSKIRETRKQNKMDISRARLGKEDHLIPHQHHQSQSRSNGSRSPTGDLHRPHQFHHHDHSPSGRKKFMSYFHCCIKA